MEYYGAQIVGKAGKLIRNIKGLQTGMFFDQKKWDGSDFSMPEGTTSMFCSQRVVDELNKINIINLKITNIKDEEWYNARVE